jgi:hypothetical protein
VHVQVAGQTPAVRYGEVRVTDSERVEGWRNLGQTEAALFWTVVSPGRTKRPRRLGRSTLDRASRTIKPKRPRTLD